MSRSPFVLPKPEIAYSWNAEIADTTIGWRFVNPRMQERFGTDAMPGTAENVARHVGRLREVQDAFALRSQERAVKAIAAGRMAREIAPPIPIPRRNGPALLVDRDEHPRDTSLELLAGLRCCVPGRHGRARKLQRCQRRCGHPLGMSGARLALSAAIDLADRTDHGARRAVATIRAQVWE
jgi:acetyl-CoA acetyltransferase